MYDILQPSIRPPHHAAHCPANSASICKKEMWAAEQVLILLRLHILEVSRPSRPIPEVTDQACS